MDRFCAIICFAFSFFWRWSLNVQEREQLTRFLQQLVRAEVGLKDSEAEKLIRDACAQQPEAHYLLVQRAVLLDQALQSAQSEIARLQKDLESVPAAGNSFLNSNAWGSASAQVSSTRPAAVCVAPVPAAPSQAHAPSWATGMLGTVATTAAGVVAGSFLFQGIEHLMGHRDHGAGPLSGDSASQALVAPTESAVFDRELGNDSAGLDSLVPSDLDLDSV